MIQDEQIVGRAGVRRGLGWSTPQEKTPRSFADPGPLFGEFLPL